MPNLKSADFVGRDDDLAELHDLLQGDQTVAIAAATGMGGVGKSRLAWEYTQRYRSQYPGGIWWVSAVEPTEVLQEFLKYGARMRFPEVPETLTTVAEQVYWCYDQWLHRSPPGLHLIVFDDVRKSEGLQQLKAFWPVDDQFRVLLTTRTQFGPPIQCLKLGVLEPDEAYQLLRSLVTDQSRVDREEEQARALCKWMGYLPLGIELAGRYFSDIETLTFRKLLERLEEKCLKASAIRQVPVEMVYEDHLEAAFELSWETLKPRSRYLGGLLATLALAPIPENLLGKCLPEWDEEALEVALNLDWVKNSLLLSLGNGTFLLHTLIHKFLGAKLDSDLASEATEIRTAAAQGVTQVAKQIPFPVTLSTLRDVQDFLPHLVIIANHWTMLLPESDLTWPMEGLARVARSQSLWSEATTWYEKALSISEEQLGENHPTTGTSLNNLAELYRSTGRYSEAEPLYVRALSISEEQLGENHPTTGTSLNNLAELYRSTGRYSEAEPLYVRALSISEEQLGENHPETGTRLNNLAGLYESTGRYSEAEPLYVRALSISEEQLGENHPTTGTSLNNLAGLYESTGRYSEAEPLYVRALSISEEQLGENHPTTGTSLNNLAGLYESTGRYSEAEPLYVRALSISEEQLGENHPTTGTSLNNLAGLYESTGRYSEAEPLYVRALSISEEQLGENHPTTGTRLNNLAGLYESTGRYSEAEPLYVRALSISEEQLGENHPTTGTSLNNLAGLYESTGRYSEAEPLYVRALGVLINQLGQEHPNTKTVINNFIAFVQTAIAEGAMNQLSDHPITQSIIQSLSEASE